MEIYYGPKYQQGMDGAKISAAIRSDIKAAVAAGALPRGKYSVRLDRFSGGKSITVTATDVDLDLFDPRFLRHEIETNGRVFYQGERFSEAQRALLKKLEKLANAYNYDGSDIQSDYFHVNYYLHVKMDWEFERERRAIEVQRVRDELQQQEATARAQQDNQKRAQLEQELTRELGAHEHPVQVSMSRRQANAPVRMGLSAALGVTASRSALPPLRALWVLR